MVVLILLKMVQRSLTWLILIHLKNQFRLIFLSALHGLPLIFYMLISFIVCG